MKIEILTVADVTIPKWKWYSNWIDVAVFDYNCQPWLIQMRISRTNKKSFRSVAITGRFYKQTTTAQVGDLTQMGNLTQTEET